MKKARQLFFDCSGWGFLKLFFSHKYLHLKKTEEGYLSLNVRWLNLRGKRINVVVEKKKKKSAQIWNLIYVRFIFIDTNVSWCIFWPAFFIQLNYLRAWFHQFPGVLDQHFCADRVWEWTLITPFFWLVCLHFCNKILQKHVYVY